uniref:Uncharacterized protein n=1 Tax=Anguilla anguilla TaxID=7936 RepID=A0A0E9XE07_ANGAN
MPVRNKEGNEERGKQQWWKNGKWRRYRKKFQKGQNKEYTS